MVLLPGVVGVQGTVNDPFIELLVAIVVPFAMKLARACCSSVTVPVMLVAVLIVTELPVVGLEMVIAGG